MRWVAKTAAGVVSAIGTGLAVGCTGGMTFALFTWGLSLWLGLAVGGAAGSVAGVLAAADGQARYRGGGTLGGACLGLLTSGGYVAYAAAYGPGFWPLDGSAVVFLAGWLVGGTATGLFSGLLAERVGRFVVGND